MAQARAHTRAKTAGQGAATGEGAAGDTALRVLKKYPNRRLYDTQTSGYITLADVKAMVLGHEHFVVRDAKTGEDLTRSILLQIILEEETGGVPMFSTEMLANVIRFYGHTMQGMMGSYLEKNIQAFSEMQARLAEQTGTATGFSPELWTQFMNGQAPMMQARLAEQTGTATGFSPELWTQFMNGQAPMMQGLMSSYLDQSKHLFSQMQEQMSKQAGTLFPAGFPGGAPKR